MEETTKQPQSAEIATTAQATTEVVIKKEKFTPELCASTISKLPAQLQGLKNCFAQPFESFRKAYPDPKLADRVLAKEIDYAAQAMTKNTYLISVATKNPLSLANSMKNIALSGLSLNPVTKLAYLVPFGGEVCFMPSYMGLVDLLLNNGLVKKIEAHTVHEGDHFEVEFGENEKLIHRPNPWSSKTKENLKGAYYIVVLADGTKMFDTMSVEEIEKIRKRAPSAKSSSPWDTDYLEMVKKSAIRRAFKMVPKSGISDSKIKALEASFDYDEKVEQKWIQSQSQTATKSYANFDEDCIEDAVAEEV